MIRFVKKRSTKAGLPPGTPVHVGERKAEKMRITVIDYDESDCRERVIATVEECFPYKDVPTVTWINVDGVHDVEAIGRLGEHFGLHPLLVEDIASTGQRPKMEDYDDHLYVVLKMLTFDEGAGQTVAEQVSLVLAENVVISFQEREGDVFDAVRERIRSARGRIRKMGADYLVYSLMDAVVDNYFVICEKLGEGIEPLQQELIEDPSPQTLGRIHSLKGEILFLRKVLWPLREVISGIERSEVELFSETTRPYLRDVYDHTIQVIDTIETYRDMIGGMVDIYLSSVSNRMNEVMKVLTIIATIFIPMTFVAGVYGMNFRHMPELGWRWGYPAVLAVMVAVAAGMLVYFRKHDWI
ncbi:MAG: magnesium/cobalt transporter CorA [Planctomycetota bacterium]|jgi:magnesium transporter